MAQRDLERIPSPLTAAIILALYKRGKADTRTIAREVGVDTRIVWSRLLHWLRKGWVRREGPLWVVTETGKAMISKYLDLFEKSANMYHDTRWR